MEGEISGRWWVAIGLLVAVVVGIVFWGRLTEERRVGRVAVARPGAWAGHGLSGLPLAAQGVVSAALGSEGVGYRISRAGDGLQAANPAQRLHVRFDGGGVQVSSGRAQMGLRLGGVGYGGSLIAVGRVVPRVQGDRVVYARPGLSEWYANGPLGLEQGFTLARAPAGRATGSLTMSLVLSGDMRASVDASGLGLGLAGARGSSLRYDDLLATDAQGRMLHSWMTLAPGRILLHVDMRGARYPLTVDPLLQQGGKLTAGEEETGEGGFGASVALSSEGTTALIGAPANKGRIGAVWVFTRSEGVWTKQAKLTGGSEESGNGEFGSSVALSADGNTALIGAPTEETPAAGAAWVFTRSGGTWTQQGKKLTSGEGAFGFSVALSSNGNVALIGGLWADEIKGAAWVYTRAESKWTQQAKLTGTEEVESARFGAAVALSSEGNTALIAGIGDTNGTGAVWVFTSSEGKWSQQGKKLTGGKEANEGGEFGHGVALSSEGNTALIGSGYFENFGAGAAWVFTRSEGAWTQQGKKLESGEHDFGSSVALSSNGNIALIGGPLPETSSPGAAWVYTRTGTTWTLQEKMTGSEEVGGGEFGSSVALSSDGEVGMIGGRADNKNIGAAWSFLNVPLLIELYGVGPNPASPNLTVCECGKPVNAATGNEAEQQADISIGGRGPGLRVVRSYNALAAAEAKEAGPWGYGWSGPYDASLTINSEHGTATVHQENGSSVVFYKDGESYTQEGWTQARLEKEGASYIYTLPTQTKLEFNSEGRLTKETERNGNSNTFTYNASKQLEKVTDGDGRSLTFKYNGEGLVESITDPMGHVVSYTYSEKQLASVTIEGKVRWKFEYESPHLLKKVTDGRGHATTIKYEATTHRVTEEEIGGHVRKWKYGTNETTITEPNGAETVETFNGAGEPTKITRAKGKGEETTTEYEYSPATYNMLKMVNGDKHEWKYGYDTEGNKTSETDPNGDEWKWEFDKKHDIIKETTPDGEATTYKRNSKGDPEVIERPIGSETQKTEYKYDEKGDVTEVIAPLTNITTFTYDAAGDKELETRARGEEYKWKYNEDSQVTEETDARGRTTKIERDEQGFPIKITDRRGNATESKYDGNYDVETTTDPNKHTTKYTYNEENLLTKVEEPNKGTTETEYDSEGQMIARKDGDGHKWEYKRNALEEVTEEKNPLGKIWKRTYEKAGNLEKLEDPEKHTTEYTYDESGRLKKVKYSTGKPSEVTYEYNKDGKVTKMTDETGTTENTYDKLDRLTEYKNGAGKTVKYEYDLANLPTKITYPNGEHVTRAYRENYKLGTITDWDGSVTTFNYTKDGTLEQIHYPSGAEDCTVYSVNEDEELTGAEFRETKCAGVVAKVAYERGKDGEITKITTKGLPGPEVNESVYDENGRLIEANKKTYEYDKANNPTEIEGATGYAYNEADELEKGGGDTYTYNEDGQRTKSKPTTGPSTSYGYDQAGNLTTVERPKEGEASEIKDTYTYDGTNLRQAQTINGTKANLTWDTAEPLPVILEDETNSYIYGPEGIPIEQISKTGTVLYLHPDPQGSTRLITNTKGETEATDTYTPYGKLEGSTGAASTPLRYDGQYTSADTGLIYLRARTYVPETAQFLTVDPWVVRTGEPYSYAADDPLNRADPTGDGYWPWEWSQTTRDRVNVVVTVVGIAGLVVAAVGAAPVTAGVLAIGAGVGAVLVGISEIAADNRVSGLLLIGGGLAGGVGAGLLGLLIARPTLVNGGNVLLTSLAFFWGGSAIVAGANVAYGECPEAP